MASLRYPRLHVLGSSAIALLGAATLLGGLAACGDDDTYTPDACDPQFEYDIRELYAEENLNDPELARQRAGIEREVAEAAAKGCVTKPTFTPPLD